MVNLQVHDYGQDDMFPPPWPIQGVERISSGLRMHSHAILENPDLFGPTQLWDDRSLLAKLGITITLSLHCSGRSQNAKGSGERSKTAWGDDAEFEKEIGRQVGPRRLHQIKDLEPVATGLQV